MATMAIGKAWEEAVAFVRREATLLFPVAMLFVALPSVLLGEMTPPELTAWAAQPVKSSAPPITGGYALTILISVLFVWFGSLTLFALALRPGISVGEALRLSLSRLPVLIGTTMLAGAVLALAVILVAMLSVLVAPAVAATGLVVIVVMGLAIFGGVRLLLLNPVVIDGQDGVLVSLRRSWALTKGHFWRLAGFMALLVLVSAIAAGAAQAVLGIIGGLLGGPSLARLIGGIGAAAVSTVVQVYMLAMLARLYRQTQPKDVAGVFR